MSTKYFMEFTYKQILHLSKNIFFYKKKKKKKKGCIKIFSLYVHLDGIKYHVWKLWHLMTHPIPHETLHMSRELCHTFKCQAPQYQRLTKKIIKLPTSGPKQNKSIREGTVSSLRTWTYHGGI